MTSNKRDTGAGAGVLPSRSADCASLRR